MSEKEKALTILNAISTGNLEDIDSIGFIRTVNKSNLIVWESV